MKQMFNRIYQLTRILEIIICIAIILAIGISLFSLVSGLQYLMFHKLDENAFQDFLAIAFNILIGIEFLKMIVKYSVDSVIEVLVFAFARQLIVEHTSVIENFVGVTSIAVLFIIRKYMSISDVDKEKKNE